MTHYTYVQWLRIADLIREGNTVWCRNGEVTPIAMPCAHLSCPYKPTPRDILSGIKRCTLWAITAGPNTDWHTARHIQI